MIRNFLTTAFRNLSRRKQFTFLNIFGLATGMACSILIFLWVADETSFDQFNDHPQNIFRVTCTVSDINAAVVPPPLAAAIKNEIAAVKNTTRIAALQRTVTIGGQKFIGKHMFYADSNFLRIFKYPLISGNNSTALSSTGNVVINEASAIKYFGSANAAMGKIITIDNDIKPAVLRVSAVLKNIPSNSHLQFDMLLPFELYDHQVNQTQIESWNNFDVYVYLQLKDGVIPNTATMSAITREMNAIQQKNDQQTRAELALQPLTDIHLHSHFMLDVEGQGSAQYVNIFALVAVFILLIACINFMNLATAMSGQRAKEVGLRKTVGALRIQLILQFISESLLLSFISAVIAIFLVYLALPLFNELASKNISFDVMGIKMILILLSVTFFTGLLAGSYPAFFLSSFNPVTVLKGSKAAYGKHSILRNGLVILQFSISVILMVSTLVIYKQLHYIRNQDIGFNKENLLYVKMPEVGDLKNNTDALKATLAGLPGIGEYTITDELPTDLTSGMQLIWRGMDPNKQVMGFRLRVDENFVNTFQMKIAAGRFFSKVFRSYDSGFVVNETALKYMNTNLSEAIGKMITVNGKEGPIIGVVRDFNFRSVHQPIAPLIMSTNKGGGYLVTRTTPANMQRMLETIKKPLQKVYGEYPFSYGFVNEDLSRLYITEQRMSQLFNIFSVISIIISCLGLYGLATFATERRTREIGVRKVLGAAESGIVVMLARDFIKLVLMALVIAFPVSWWLMTKWLESFAYKSVMSWWIFAASGIVALVIAFATVSFQTIRAAMANPVKSLRTE